MSLVCDALLPHPTSLGENGVSYDKIPPWVGLQGTFVKHVAAFNQVR